MLGSIRMKKIAFVLAAAGLMSLAACTKPTPAENNTAAIGDNLEAVADNIDEVADNTSNAVAADALENAADGLHNAADAVTSNM
jgi:hypothetical protein